MCLVIQKHTYIQTTQQALNDDWANNKSDLRCHSGVWRSTWSGLALLRRGSKKSKAHLGTFQLVMEMHAAAKRAKSKKHISMPKRGSTEMQISLGQPGSGRPIMPMEKTHKLSRPSTGILTGENLRNPHTYHFQHRLTWASKYADLEDCISNK